MRIPHHPFWTPILRTRPLSPLNFPLRRIASQNSAKPLSFGKTSPALHRLKLNAGSLHPVIFTQPQTSLEPVERRIRLLVWMAAIAFGLLMFWDSASRWAHFQYETFDLAFYVQALWKLVHGHGGPVSLLNVPLLGEHANVIVLLLVPLYALIPHPLLPVAVQTLVIASMGPVGFRIARRLGIAPGPAGLLALAVLLTPATGFVALHEFHPEALTAPFLLLAIDAFQRQSVRRFWLWFLATLACKENMTLLLALWCAVNAFTRWREFRRSGNPGFRPWLLKWCVWPGGIAVAWAVLFMGVLTPLWNSGNIDFTGLYRYLNVPLDAWPQAISAQLAKSLRGNLLPGLLLPFCGLSLFRPRWLLIAAPVIAQHLLSFRSSEWNISLHYAAPLIPLFWVAACEAIAGFSSCKLQPALAGAVVAACVAGQAWIGPAHFLLQAQPAIDLAGKEKVVATVPREASVVAGMAFLSHLAERDQLISLHHILKGLRTLSTERFQMPAPTDCVIVDYSDPATFDPVAGYYHPDMRTQAGSVIPSSDRLLYGFLRQASWDVSAHNSITVFRKRTTPPKNTEAPFDAVGGTEIAVGKKLDATTELVSVKAAMRPAGILCIESRWIFSGEPTCKMGWDLSEGRKLMPWLMLRLVPEQGGPATWIQRGLCAPEAGGVLPIPQSDLWTASLSDFVPPGRYTVQAFFFDNPKLRWARMRDPAAVVPPLASVELGAFQAP